ESTSPSSRHGIDRLGLSPDRPLAVALIGGADEARLLDLARARAYFCAKRIDVDIAVFTDSPEATRAVLCRHLSDLGGGGAGRTPGDPFEVRDGRELSRESRAHLAAAGVILPERLLVRRAGGDSGSGATFA